MNDIRINIAEADKALVEKPLLATSVERFLILDEIKSSFKHLPQPINFGNTLSCLLSRVSTPIEAHDLILGRCVDRELSVEEEKKFSAFIKHPDYPSNHSLLECGHCTFSWDLAVTLGLSGLKQMAQDKLDSLTDSPSDSDKRIFLEGTISIYDAIKAYILRYADAAERAGLLKAAEAAREAADRPKSFRAALQLLWFIALIDCAYITENPTLTLGRMDQFLYPLYRADIESGKLTEDGAALLITDYYCKHNLIMGRGEHQVGDESNSTTFKRILNFDAPQYLLLGGTDANKSPVCNELTLLFAKCIVPTFKNPVVVFRYVKDTDKLYPELWQTLCQKALQSAALMFYNDANIRSTYERIGLTANESANYAHFGCNWCSTGDNGAWMLIGPWGDKYQAHLPKEERISQPSMFLRCNTDHAWPEDLMICLRSLAKAEDEQLSIDEIYRLFLARMEDFIDRKLAYLSKELEIRQKYPSAVLTLGDCFYRHSLECAECFSASAKYHFEIQSFQMFGTIVDSIIAIDKLVIQDRRITLKQLLVAVDANFEGYEDILALLRHADKYGMDTPLSNYHVQRLSKAATDLVISKSAPYFERQGLFLFPCMQSDTWHLKYGEGFGATPDGRLAGTPFSQNLRPSNGACKNGLTAMLRSMTLLPHDGLVSGALNLDVHKRDFDGEAGIERFSALLSTYFNNGGLNAQVSTLNADDLIDAKQNPSLHRDIRVRVTGYSGVFVDMCERLQNDIIERMK